jgi:transcription termination factor Rho
MAWSIVTSRISAFNKGSNMSDTASGIFDFEQMNVIRDAHRDWCAEQSIDVDSPVGHQSAGLMFEAYKAGKTTREELIAVCEEYVRQRQEHVQLGATPIESRS